MKIPLKGHWDLLINYLRPQRVQVTTLAVLLFSSIGLQLVNPQILRYFIDTARSGGTLGMLTGAALLFIGVAVLTQVLSVAATYLGEKVGWAATNDLRADLALHCLHLDMSFHNARTPGEMIERIDGDVANLANFFSQFVIRILGNIILLAGVMVVLFNEDWRVGATLAGYAALTLTGLFLLGHIAVPHWKEARQASADLFGFLEEHLAGTEDIRSSGATTYAVRLLHKFTGERLRKERKAGLMNIWLRILTTAFYILGQILALVVGLYLFKAGSISVGTVFMILHYNDTLFRPLEQITRQMEDLQKASASIGRIDELYRTESKTQDGPGVDFPSGPLSVEFQGISFGYNHEETVLRDLSFSLKPGRALGLLGRTGSGKTTITRLLSRLYDPTDGVIRLGGADIRQARLADLRRHVGMVTQNVQLFRAAVRDNLAFFDPTITDDRILQKVEELGLTEWYRSLPDGLSTMLESGGGLSAGEAQLLALARVFLRDPGLLILDEASSRLDPATERLIERAVDKLFRNRTGIIIAHRLATVHRADEIMILEDGRIREYGEREKLVRDPASRFSELLRTGLQEVLV